jgi:hypothetical protein
MNSKKYIPHKDRDKRISSAVTAITALLPLDLYIPHKKELLSTCIWKITEADGKFKVRYWSEGALIAPVKQLRHEHVFERKELIERLMSGENIASVISDAIACIVTKDEHDLLSASAQSGWKRYHDCQIGVFDSRDQVWL